MTTNDFLSSTYNIEDLPTLAPPSYPHFQYNSRIQGFEFPIESRRVDSITGEVQALPLWSSILDGAGWNTQKVRHGRRQEDAYVQHQLHFCILGTHVFWFDQNLGPNPPRFQHSPNPKPQGSRFISRFYLLGLVKEIEAHAPGTLCYLSVKGVMSKSISTLLNNFDQQILRQAHTARLARMKQENPNYPETTKMLFPRWTFWMPIKSGEPVNVAPIGQGENYVAPIVGGWPAEADLHYVRGLFIPTAIQTEIQSSYLPQAKAWIASQEAKWQTAAMGEVVMKSVF